MAALFVFDFGLSRCCSWIPCDMVIVVLGETMLRKMFDSRVKERV